MIKLIMLLFVFSCSSLEDQIEGSAPSKKANKSEVQSTIKRNNLKPLVYSRTSEVLKGPSLFYRETTDGLSDSGKASNDKVQEIVKLCRKRNITGGLNVAKKHSVLYSKWPSYWNALGLCYLKNNELYKARTFFKRAIGIQSTYSPAYNNLALLDIKSNYPYSALSNFKLALKYNTSSQVSSFNLARLYLSYGLGVQAISYFSRIKDPQFYKRNVAVLMAIAQTQAGNHKSAITSFSKIPNLNRNQKIYYAHSLAKVGRKKEAALKLNGINLSRNQNGYFLLRDTKRLL